MSNGVKLGVTVVAGLVLAGLLVVAGFVLAGVLRVWPSAAWAQGGWGPRMMGGFAYRQAWDQSFAGSGGMMGGYGGMMGGSGGMMGVPGAFGSEPLSLEQAESAVADYLAGLGDDNLTLGEIMIFDNHAYAQIVEADTGIGAMEVLVDPVTLAVYPEPGPNMMWNARYGHMAGVSGMGMMGGRLGGMMGGWTNRAQAQDPQAEMPVSQAEAVEAAQAYLDQLGTGLAADEHADRFYGYYTLHVLQEGATVGMLSVNGYSGQVFLHNWHGDFIDMSKAHDE